MPNRHVCIAVVLLFLTAGCTEPDETVVVDIGTMFTTFGDRDLQTQIVAVRTSSTPYTLQSMEWNVEQILLAGLSPGPIDLMFGDPTCGYLDTAFVLPRRDGKCGDGVVIDADGNTRQATLQVKTRITVRWLDPPPSWDLSPDGDYDFDEVANSVDNCLLIANNDQFDTGMKGFGDACATFEPFFGVLLLDSDRDGVADITDNCPYISNPDQADDGTEYPPGSGVFVPDAIGNACESNEESVDIMDMGSFTIDLDLGPTSVLQPFRGNSFLNAEFADAVSCDFLMGTCTINPAQVVLCFDVTGSFACPG